MTNAKKQNAINTWARRWAVPLVVAAIFIVLYIVIPSIELELGFFFWAGLYLFLISGYCLFLFIYAKHQHAKDARQKALIVLTGFLVSILVAAPIITYAAVIGPQNAFVTRYHSYNQTDPTQMYELQKFMNNTMIYGNESQEVMVGYDINFHLSEDPMFHGILGLIYGGAAMIIASIGWWSKPPGIGESFDMNPEERRKKTELAKVIFNFNMVLSIIFAVVILAAENQILMGSLRYVFIVTSFILAVLLFTLGFLASYESGANGTPLPGLFMTLVISFTVGFVVGDMAFPVTRVPLGSFGVPLGSPGGKTLYGVYAGQYLFMCASMFTIALISAIRANREPGEGQQGQWRWFGRVRKEVSDSIKSLTTVLSDLYEGLNDLNKRLDEVMKEAKKNSQLLSTVQERVAELEAKTKKPEGK